MMVFGQHRFFEIVVVQVMWGRLGFQLVVTYLHWLTIVNNVIYDSLLVMASN
jgi:hypothetical protein